eukprot:TRINITY_DN16945_c0_g2_i1.p1 TRINITY_DN16945_c0_g2~~TRINITY_DN16945_c0_g2_i1.p1  ORF type:complete len:130 (+),score=14.51 TRINITY_DN16945_c0_g2_i1:20-409(+)
MATPTGDPAGLSAMSTSNLGALPSARSCSVGHPSSRSCSTVIRTWCASFSYSASSRMNLRTVSASSAQPSRIRSSSRPAMLCIHDLVPVSYTHLRAHETPEHLVCRLLLEKKKKDTSYNIIHITELHLS